MIQASTLILNSDGNPLSIIPLSAINWQEAIKLLYQHKVEPIEFYDNWVVHSQKLAYQVPAIVMTKKFYNNTTRIRFTKQNLYYRDQGCCQYCGNNFETKELTIDHVIPKSMGGTRSWSNTVLSCGPCNWSRGNDISVQPIKKPVRPTYFELMVKRKKFPVKLAHESWNIFLNWPEELVSYHGSVFKTEDDENPFDVEKIIKNNRKK
jgi:5-methylcytosine-specific restriction endonuclease McrA